MATTPHKALAYRDGVHNGTVKIVNEQGLAWTDHACSSGLHQGGEAAYFPHAVYTQALGPTEDGGRATSMDSSRKDPIQDEHTAAGPLDCEALFQEYIEKFRQMVQFYSELNMEIQGHYSGSRGDVWGFQGSVIRDAFIVRYCNPNYVSCSKAALDEYLQCLTNCNDKWVHKKPRNAQDRRDRRDESNTCFQKANKKVKQCINLYKLPQPLTDKPPLEKPPSQLGESRNRDCDEAQLNIEIRKIYKIQDALTCADKEFQNQKMKLGVMRIAAGKKRNKIKYLQSIIKGGDFSEAVKHKLEKTVEQLEYELLEIQNERDQEVKYALYNYDDALRSMRKAYQTSKCDEVKRLLKSLGERYAKKRTFVEFELLLAASNPWERDKFYAAANKYLEESKYRDIVFLMRALDYIEQKDPRSALYALRKSLEENPDNKTAQEMLKKIEAGYLRSIDEKTLGEAAGVRSELWSHLEAHGEEGFLDSFESIWDYATIGVTTSVSAIGGKPMALVDLASTIGDEALVQHAGLILIIRLREAGVPLEKIDTFNNEKFIAETQKLFNWNLTQKEALKLRFSIRMAFDNPDVKRLATASRQMFDIDLGKSYFNSDAFDATWQDWIGDVVNIKNVVVMLGPSAVISTGGKLAMPGSELVKDTLTVRDAFTNLIHLPELADRFAKTGVGQACIRELFKFNQSTSLVSKVVAEALVQQGMIKAGEMLGGRAGGLAADVLTTLGVGDIDQALRILKQNGVTPKTLSKLARNLRKAVEGAEQIGITSKKYIGQLEEALEETTKKGAISSPTRKTIKKSQDEMEKIAQKLMRKAEVGDISLVQRHQYEQLDFMRKAFNDAMSGNRAGATVAKKTVENLEEQSLSAIERLTKQAHTVEDLADGLKKVEPDLTIKRAQNTKALQTVIRDPGLEAPLSQKSVQTAKEIMQEAEELRHMNLRFDDDKAISSVADNALRGEQFEEAIDNYKRLLARTDIDDSVRNDLSEKLRIATQTQDGAKRLMPDGGSGSPAVREAMRDFEADELKEMTQTEKLVPLKTSSGENSLSKPYTVMDGNDKPIGVFKPTVSGQRPNRIDVKGEIIGYRLAKHLEINTPASEAITFKIDRKEQKGVIVRFIENSEDLAVHDAGIQRAIKKQVAEDRALSVFLGDPDRHSSNIRITKDGEVFFFDHGNADIFEPNHVIDWANKPTDADIEKKIIYCMHVRSKYAGAGDAIIDGIDRQISWEDMEKVVRQIEAMDDKRIRSLLEGVMDEGNEMEWAVQCLMLRKKNLREVLKKNFPPIQRSFSLNSWKHRLMTAWTPFRAQLRWPPVRIAIGDLCGDLA